MKVEGGVWDSINRHLPSTPLQTTLTKNHDVNIERPNTSGNRLEYVHIYVYISPPLKKREEEEEEEKHENESLKYLARAQEQRTAGVCYIEKKKCEYLCGGSFVQNNNKKYSFFFLF